MTMLIRRTILGALSALFLSSVAFAQDKPVYFATEGVALAGYDPVTYFEGATPVMGAPENAVMWKGAKWHFSSAENRERFESNPRAFAPQFGGYCSYAMANGVLKSTDPNAWQVVDGRLYLTHSPQIEVMWRQDRAEYIEMAEENWPVILYQK
ncbi:YHS domain protein [Ruegeria sp. HKCCD4884]|uniref:YHS domain-containing (seleno)protein n=1 Tax=Ruegeria sp. HKCCD4884 TaxID=2683022 RepID=UPI001491C62D|nr:YHS domain-containing (seleno)protein [Ruegeria sp. HKCCD4884]NOD92271.1 YHS domain protein [Ruegeria sp. HKCCD4884]